MKNLSGFTNVLTLTILILLIPAGVFSQEVIKFKDGTAIKAYIKSRHNDTVFYQVESQPNVTMGTTMDEIDTIMYLQDYHGELTGPESPLSENDPCSQYKAIKGAGIGFMVGGGIITIVGAVLMIPPPSTNIFTEPEDVNSHLQTGGLVVGIGAFVAVAGTVMTSVGSAKLKECRKNKPRLSFDIKYTPSEKGMKLVYRF